MNTSVQNHISHTRSQSTLNKHDSISALNLSLREKNQLLKELDLLEKGLVEQRATQQSARTNTDISDDVEEHWNVLRGKLSPPIQVEQESFDPSKVGISVIDEQNENNSTTKTSQRRRSTHKRSASHRSNK